MQQGDDSDITTLLAEIRTGGTGAVDKLVALVYDKLEAMARHQLAGRTSLESHGLVHELYLRLARGKLDARDRAHFFAIAAVAMRQILADRARRRLASKRGGGAARVTLSGLEQEVAEFEVIAVHDALDRLEALNPRHARVVELRCLVGLTIAEIAAELAVSERTVYADWRMARAWLLGELAAPTG